MNKLQDPIPGVVDAVAEAEGVKLATAVLGLDDANVDALLFQALPRERPGWVLEVSPNDSIDGLPVDGVRDGVDVRGRAQLPASTRRMLMILG